MADRLVLLAVALDDEKELDDDDDIVIFALVSTFMRRNLNRSQTWVAKSKIIGGGGTAV